MKEKFFTIQVNERGKKSLDYKHPWIYQKSCIINNTKINAGDIVFISYKNDIQAAGFFDGDSLFAVKILEFNVNPENFNIDTIIKTKILKAAEYRKKIGAGDVCRLVHGEADGIPGLFVERYGEQIVIQYAFNGIYGLKENITNCIKELFPDCPVYEINPAREKKIVSGKPEFPIKIEMDGIKFYFNPDGQKTGFYLDQRVNRINLSKYAKENARVLDAFAYTGAFALYCMKNGASADIIEYNKKYSEQFAQNCALNGWRESRYRIYNGRSEEILKTLDCKYDMIFLDPPALVSKKHQIKNALQYIHNIFIEAAGMLKPGGIISVSVCSNSLTGDSLNRTLMNACAAIGKQFRIIYENRAGLDHPAILNFPDGDYLKCIGLQML